MVLASSKSFTGKETVVKRVIGTFVGQPNLEDGRIHLLSKRNRLFRLFKMAARFPQFAANDVFVHPDSVIGKHTDIETGTRINGAAYIDSSPEAPCRIGKFCAIAQNFKVRTANHHTGYINSQAKFQVAHGFQFPTDTKGPVTIGHNVWIGDDVTVLSGVSIGNGAVIGSGAIVTKDVPPFCIAVGVPAKVVKKRFSEQIIKQLATIQWWNWSDAKIERNKAFFETDFSRMEEADLSKIIT